MFEVCHSVLSHTGNEHLVLKQEIHFLAYQVGNLWFSYGIEILDFINQPKGDNLRHGRDIGTIRQVAILV